MREKILEIVSAFLTGAVGGVVRPCNDVELENGWVKKYQLPKNPIACMQVIEYDSSFKDVCKAILMCLFEITFMHFVLTYVRATAFIGYQKKKLQWGCIERKKINLK